jgi:hypothetical protein
MSSIRLKTLKSLSANIALEGPDESEGDGMAAVRLPQHLGEDAQVDSGQARLRFDLLEDIHGPVGETERQVETAIQALRDYDAAGPGDTRARTLLLEVAVEAVWRLVVLHEACNLHDHSGLIARYRVPPEVLARIGSLH